MIPQHVEDTMGKHTGQITLQKTLSNEKITNNGALLVQKQLHSLYVINSHDTNPRLNFDKNLPEGLGLF